MTPAQTAALMIVFLFGYIFSCVIAYHVYLRYLDRAMAESPMIIIWPLVLLFFIFVYAPVHFFMWICKTTERNAKRIGSKGKYKTEIVK